MSTFFLQRFDKMHTYLVYKINIIIFKENNTVFLNIILKKRFFLSYQITLILFFCKKKLKKNESNIHFFKPQKVLMSLIKNKNKKNFDSPSKNIAIAYLKNTSTSLSYSTKHLSFFSFSNGFPVWKRLFLPGRCY